MIQTRAFPFFQFHGKILKSGHVRYVLNSMSSIRLGLLLWITCWASLLAFDNCTLCGHFEEVPLYCPNTIGCALKYPPIDCLCNDMSLCRVVDTCEVLELSHNPLIITIQHPKDEATRIWLKSCDASDRHQHFNIEHQQCVNIYEEISWAFNTTYNITVEGGILNQGIPIIMSHRNPTNIAQKWIYNRDFQTFSPLGSPNLCMTAYNSQNLTLLECEEGKSSQMWYLQPINPSSSISTFQIISYSASECLSCLLSE